MINSVIEAIEHYNMLKGVSVVTVALSGGADSVALFNVLLSLEDKYGIKVKAAHLNHNLRGEESDRDEQFVRDICKKADVELIVKSVDVNLLAQQQKQSIELAARNARYEFFADCEGVVATAHTADDNIETVLLNLIRGTGIEGLCGIPPVRCGFIRPLILCTRQQVEQFCANNGLDYVTDSTNLTDDYSRNKLRHNAVKVLKDINPAAATAAVRSCAVLRDESRYLNLLANEQYERLAKESGLDVAAAKEVDAALLRRVLRKYVNSMTGCLPDNYHTEQLLTLVYKGEGRCQLQGGYYARVLRKKLIILQNEQKSISFSVKTRIIDIEEYKKLLKINSLLSKNALDCDKIIGDTVIRCRTAGDRIKLKGRGTKTLKKLYNELGIAQNMRERLPVIADDSGVIWVYNAGTDVRGAVNSNTKKVLLISAEQLQ